MARSLPVRARADVRTSFLMIALVGVLCVAAAPAYAQRHRARMSADLVDHVRAQSPRIDVIVHGDKAEVDALAARYNVPVKRYLKFGAVLRVNAGQLEALDQDDAVDHLSGDTIIRSSADVTAESIGADQVWAGGRGMRPLTGDGVVVAVIDSGIDTRHPALKDRVIYTRDFTGGDGMDRFGHGTHVAGLIAGAAGGTADTREYSGIAPGARLVNLRALGDDGSGTVSTVIEAIDWAIDHRHELRIRVINLSLGAPVLQPYRDDPLCEAVERAVAAGIVVVAAAGNQGRSGDGKTVLGSITSPGNSPYALTVGALDTHATAQRSDDSVAAFSSRGPTRYDLVIKPDVAAPGVRVVSTEASGSYLATTYADRHVGGSGGGGYMEMSGSSMATAVVSGAVALLIDQRPNASPANVKQLLQLASSFVSGAGIFDVGVGSTNVLAAVVLNQPGKRNASLEGLIAGELVTPSGLLVATEKSGKQAIIKANLASIRMTASSIVWTNSIVWSGSIEWTNSIVWSASENDSIIWTGADGCSIVWTGSIVWTNAAPVDFESIVWSGTVAESIVWTSSLDSIVWTNSFDSIVWTNTKSDE